MPGATTRFCALYSCISGMFVEQQLVLHIGEKQVSKSSRRAVTALQTGDWKPSSCAYLSGWHQCFHYKYYKGIWFGLRNIYQQKDKGPNSLKKNLGWKKCHPWRQIGWRNGQVTALFQRYIHTSWFGGENIASDHNQ